MEEAYHLRIRPSIENLVQVVVWVEAFCEANPRAAEYEYKLQLISEELFLNAVNHAYGPDRPDGLVWLNLLPQPEGAALIIEDEGEPFNPLEEAPEPDLESSLEDRDIGGLGLMLVREMSDQAAYSRAGNRNRLALVFGPGPLPEASGAEEAPERRAPGGVFGQCRPRGITTRIVAILVALLTIGTVAAAGLNYLKFERILIETAAARYDPVLRELSRVINDSLRSGLTLESTRTTQQLIDRSAAQFEGAFDLVVRDMEGVRLFGTGDFENLPETLPPPGGILSDFSDPARFVGHMSIIQNGIAVGTLSLSHSADEARATVPVMAQGLRRVVGVSLLPILPLLVIVSVFVLGRIEGRFHSRILAVTGMGEFKSGDPLAEAIQQVEESINPGL